MKSPMVCRSMSEFRSNWLVTTTNPPLKQTSLPFNVRSPLHRRWLLHWKVVSITCGLTPGSTFVGSTGAPSGARPVILAR